MGVRVAKNVNLLLTKERIMKLLLGLLLSMVLSTLHAEVLVSPEYLRDGKLERVSVCTLGKNKAQCIYIRKGEKLYKIFIDHKGEHSIYWISPTGDILVYSRSSV